MKPFKFFFGISLGFFLLVFFARFFIMAFFAAMIMSLFFYLFKGITDFFGRMDWEGASVRRSNRIPNRRIHGNDYYPMPYQQKRFDHNRVIEIL